MLYTQVCSGVVPSIGNRRQIPQIQDGSGTSPVQLKSKLTNGCSLPGGAPPPRADSWRRNLNIFIKNIEL